MNIEIQKPTSVVDNGEIENQPRLFEVGARVVVETDHHNGLLEYKIAEVLEQKEQYILKPINRIHGSDTDSLQLFPFRVVKAAPPSEAEGGFRRSIMDIIKHPLEGFSHAKPNVYVPEIQRPLDPRFKAILDAQVEDIIADDDESPKPAMHSPKVEALLPVIKEELAETAIAIDVLENEDIEDVPRVRVVGNEKAVVNKISIFGTTTDAEAVDVDEEPRHEDSEKPVDEVETYTIPEVKAEANPAVTVEEKPQQLEENYEAKTIAEKAIAFAEKKLKERPKMYEKLKGMYEHIINDANDLKVLSTYWDKDAFRIEAQRLEQKLADTAIEFQLFNIHDIELLEVTAADTRSDVTEQADEATKQKAEKLLPFTRGMAGVLGVVKTENAAAFSDLSEICTKLQAIIKHSYDNDIDRDAILEIAQKLEGAYNPTESENVALFDKLRDATELALQAIDEAK